MEIQKAGHYNVVCMKTRALGWNENYGRVVLKTLKGR